ncbi:MAG TPA: tetratricopeptide repeat protein [Thermoanaerobaculia bacterium]|nr:tetratricopeptide repeat protein [Thermoanaerobaculia bacterium]
MTDWLSASAMLLAGLIVGFMFLYGMKRRRANVDADRADLEAKRDALLARLREDPSDKQLELQAAEVLKKLDKLRVGTGAPARPASGEAPAATPSQSRNAALIGFAWGAGSVAVLAGIGFFVWQQAKPKETAMPPQQQSAMASPAANDPLIQQLQRNVDQNPNDLNLRDDLAKAYLDRDDLTGVAQQTRVVLQKNPNDARALTYQALVHIAARQPEAAAAMLQKATQVDPDLLDAWVGLAWLHAASGEIPQAQAAIDEAKKRHPDQAARLDDLMNHLRNPQQMAQAQSQQQEPPPAAADPAPQSQPAAAPAASGESVRITLNAANTAYPPTAVIWVIARPAGSSAGPPAAVKRVPLGSFPMTVELSASDSMMGQPLPPKMHIEARIDSDGDPMTRDPKDPIAQQDGVAVGQSLTLNLK